MSDRCPVTIVCLKKDAHLFALLGFEQDEYCVGYEHNPEVVQMTDPEAKYGHAGRMPRGVPFIGRCGATEEFGAYHFVSDGQTIRDIRMHGEMTVVPIMTRGPQAGQITQECLKEVKEFIVLRHIIESTFQRKGHSDEDPRSALTDFCPQWVRDAIRTRGQPESPGQNG